MALGEAKDAGEEAMREGGRFPVRNDRRIGDVRRHDGRLPGQPENQRKCRTLLYESYAVAEPFYFVDDRRRF